MVNEEDIRLSGEDQKEPQNPLNDSNWRAPDRGAAEDNAPEVPVQDDGAVDDGAQDDGAQDDGGQDDAAEPPAAGNDAPGNDSPGNANGASGRTVKPAGSVDIAEEGAQSGEDSQAEDGELAEAGEMEIPEKISKERKDQGEAGIEQPWGIEFDAGNGWMLGGLALVLVLLACLVADIIRRRKKKSGRKSRSGAAAAAYTAGGSVEIADYQHIGAREDQQDSYDYSNPDLYAQQGVMAVVADGMGGLANGKAVSSALVRTFIDGFPQVSGYYTQASDILLDLSIRANARINQMLRGADRSGSTLVSALVRDGYLHFLTVGDSRIYLYRGGALLQLNREHIYQEELAVKAVNQAVAMAQVRSDRQAHSLTSYFGIGRIPSVDRNDEGIRLVPGDRILLASDGVFGTLSREQMEQALKNNIVEAANQMGSMIRTEDKPYQDNNTLVILEYKG